MTYFILGKDESKENLMFESNILGEESLGTWYPSQGMLALHNMIHNNPDSIKNFSIFDDQGNTYNIEEFLSVIEKLKIKST